MDDDELGRKLDRIATILRLAHADALARAEALVRSEPAKSLLLDAAEDWVPAGALASRVAKQVKKTERSIRTYIHELLEARLLEKRGASKATEYRSTSVF